MGLSFGASFTCVGNPAPPIPTTPPSLILARISSFERSSRRAGVNLSLIHICLAAAIAKGEAPVNGCPVGGEPVGKVIAAIMGQEVVETTRPVSYTHLKIDIQKK